MARSCPADMYVMLIDESAAIAFNGGPLSWASDKEWRADGMDPRLFSTGYVPMKPASGVDLVGCNAPASKGYALAHRARRVKGPPWWMASLTLSAECVIKHLFDGSLEIHPQIDTLAFKKPIDKKNHPGIADAVAHPISPDVGERLLQFRYDQFAKRRRLRCWNGQDQERQEE